MNSHIVERGVDLLLDPRLPHAAPYNLWRLWRYALPRQLPRLGEPLCLCLTFDIEHDYRNPASAAAAERFLGRYVAWARAHDWRSTLYIQGSLVPAFAGLIRDAEKGHEIGLHGLHHEVWGRSRWWQYRLGFRGLSTAEKRERLLEALEHFDRARLNRPRSFRAPYLNADRTTLKLLAQHGFTSDSSPASYLGAVPVPRWRDGIWQVPVTANPRPEWSLRAVRYRELTLGDMLDMSKTELMATIGLALQLQRQAGAPLPPHLVLLAHPWEFEPTPGVPHASHDNWGRLSRIVEAVTQAYPVVFTTLSALITRGSECNKRLMRERASTSASSSSWGSQE